ncbi:MAG TPA: hypothetical protein VFO76_09170 [Candidatus Kapabacteria bacterium]|nr:hypothetical protein [Candidatus Kapabacteria bacterium]
MKKLGSILIYTGIAGFVAAVIVSFTQYSGLDQGAIPAASVFFILIGMCFLFPTMLSEGDTDNAPVSTMRVIVFSIVMVFVIIYIKIGWNAGSFEDFTIDKSWIYILGLALGGKTMQKFAEQDDDSTTHPPPNPPAPPPGN